jgi:hydrogenase nickel incorporation protein HypA/HybF
MHELSIIANLFEIMEEKAAEKNAKKITHVVLQVGTLSGVVPDLLITAFDIYKKDTMASEGELTIKEVPLKILCRDCKTEVVKDDFVFICTKCGSTNLKTLSGTELYLEKMELEID